MLNYRNPIYNTDGTIDCEVEHPTFGWIPFTANSSDPEQDGVDLFNQIVTDGGIDPYVSDLPSIRLIARAIIDIAAERARHRHITPGSGQAMVYLKKGEETDAYILAGYPADTTGYPFVEAEINATGKTKENAADDIITQRDAWVVLGASIEEQRLGGKKAVDDAADEAAVDTARDAAIVALDAI